MTVTESFPVTSTATHRVQAKPIQTTSTANNYELPAVRTQIPKTTLFTQENIKSTAAPQAVDENGLPVANLSVTFTYGVVTFILGAMAFMTALAWREALSRYFNEKHKLKDYGPWAAALIITGVAVILVMFLAHVKHRIVQNYNIPLKDVM